MEMEEVKVEAEGQRSDLLGRRCKEKVRREALWYLGVTASWCFVGWAVDADAVKPAFYSAVATIAPVLLLALLLRFGQARAQIAEIGASVDRTEANKRELRDEVEPMLDEAKTELRAIEGRLAGTTVPDGLAQQIQGTKGKVAEIDAQIGPDPHFSAIRLHRLSEENFAGLLLALAVAVIALYAALMMLAAGESWTIGFAFTASGLSWLIREIAQLEITGFATRAWANKSGG